MAVIYSEDIRGAYIERKVICSDCIKGEEWDSIKEGQVIIAYDVEEEDKSYFCNRCGKQL